MSLLPNATYREFTMATALKKVILPDSDRQYGAYTRGRRTLAPSSATVAYQEYGLHAGGTSHLPAGTLSQVTMATALKNIVIGAAYGDYSRVYKIVLIFPVSIFSVSAVGMAVASGKDTAVGVVAVAGGKVTTTAIPKAALGVLASGLVTASQGQALFADSRIIGANGIATTSGAISAVALGAIAESLAQTFGSIAAVTFHVSAAALGQVRAQGGINRQAFSVSAVGRVSGIGSATPPVEAGQIKCVVGTGGPGGGTAVPRNAVH